MPISHRRSFLYRLFNTQAVRALAVASFWVIGADAGAAQGKCADLALILAIDASGRIDEGEFHLQQLGYGAAFASPRVQAALAQAGVVDVGVVYWGDPATTPQILPLQRIGSAAEARALGQRITEVRRLVSGDTGIGGGVMAAIDMLQAQAGCAERRIINVSGDGRETLAPRPRNLVPLALARERAEAERIVINALAIETDEPELAGWFRERLITGDGAFVMKVDRFEAFGDALIEKLVREISVPAVAVRKTDWAPQVTRAEVLAGLAMQALAGLRTWIVGRRHRPGPSPTGKLSGRRTLRRVTDLDRAPSPVPTVRGAFLMLLLAAFFWGSGNVANKTILETLDPWTALLLRCLVACLLLLPLAWREQRGRVGKAWVLGSLLPSALFALTMVLQQKGFETASVTTGSFLINLGCVMTPLLAFVLLREMPDRATLWAAFFMVAGAATMSGVFLSVTAVSRGDILCLLSALGYACWSLALGRHAKRHGRPISTTLVHCVVTAAVMLPPALMGQTPDLADLREALPEVLYLGIFSTALAFLLTVSAQERVSASTATILIAAESLFGAAGGILLLGERPGPGVVIGAVLMIAAVCIVARAPLPPERRHAQPRPAAHSPPG